MNKLILGLTLCISVYSCITIEAQQQPIFLVEDEIPECGVPPKGATQLYYDNESYLYLKKKLGGYYVCKYKPRESHANN